MSKKKIVESAHLRRELVHLVKAVRVALDDVTDLLANHQTDPQRGPKLAAALNNLEIMHDRAKVFGLGEELKPAALPLPPESPAVEPPKLDSSRN